METSKKNPGLAALLSIIPGLGQFYNRQVLKGILCLAIAIGFVVELLSFGFVAFHGFIKLGTTPMVDHSLFLMI